MKCAKKYDKPGSILDIAPQEPRRCCFVFKQAKISTFDINPNSKATYIADICKTNQEIIPDDSFDLVICTEVLEHTLDPFAATKRDKKNFLNPGVLLSFPFLSISEFMDRYQTAGDLQNMVSEPS